MSLSDEHTIEPHFFGFDRREMAARMAHYAQSPIEIMFGLAMLDLCKPEWELRSQFKAASYRIDWALLVPGRKPIFIECDGNEFHTKPEDVERDRRRDIRIRRAGIKLFRFTGSQIYHDAKGCAQRVYDEAVTV